jgi:hypothetical protein
MNQFVTHTQMETHYQNATGKKRTVKAMQHIVSNGNRTIQVEVIQQDNSPYAVVKETVSNGSVVQIRKYKVSIDQMNRVVNDDSIGHMTPASTTHKPVTHKKIKSVTHKKIKLVKKKSKSKK